MSRGITLPFTGPPNGLPHNHTAFRRLWCNGLFGGWHSASSLQAYKKGAHFTKYFSFI